MTNTQVKLEKQFDCHRKSFVDCPLSRTQLKNDIFSFQYVMTSTPDLDRHSCLSSKNLKVSLTSRWNPFWCLYWVVLSISRLGYGLVCHRALRCICEMIGIKDIYVKLEGPSNIQSMTKAFFIGLLKQVSHWYCADKNTPFVDRQNCSSPLSWWQRTHQQLANEKGLYLVEFREERGDVPHVVAVPNKCRTAEEIPTDEVLDYSLVRLPPHLPLLQQYLKDFTRFCSLEFAGRDARSNRAWQSQVCTILHETAVMAEPFSEDRAIS